MVILLFVQEEFSYDRHLNNVARIYRVIRETRMKGTSPRYTSDTLGQLAPALQSEFPEIQRTARLYARRTWVSYGDKGFFQHFCLIDSEFLDFFGYRLRDGDAKHVLSEPNTVVITEIIAKKFFGDEDPVGKVIAVEERQMNYASIDEDFLDMFELELVLGKNISKIYTEDGVMEFILNETAAKQLGWADPIGKQMEWTRGGLKGTVVGVVKDFHFASVHHKIGPLFLFNRQEWFGYISLKVRANDMPETITFLADTWEQFLPNRPFKFYFLAAQIEKLYRSEIKLRQVFGVFFVLAIFVASLGLFALAAYTAELRTKNIGIRKVLGASVPNIVYLFSKDFVKLVMVANLIAWPIAFYAMDGWLQNFVYRVDLSIWPFLLGGALILVIALATVGYQAIKAATAHPIDSLRYE